MDGLIKAIALGVLRNLASAGGAWLAAHGVANASQEQSFIGAVCFLGALAFTAYDKLVAHRKIQAAAATPRPANPRK